jgi:hypothetical protein
VKPPYGVGREAALAAFAALLKAGLKPAAGREEGGGRAGKEGCGDGVDLRPGGGGYDMMNCCTFESL